MQYHVYVLYAPDFDQIYVGFSNNVQGRLLSHNVFAKKGWTIRYRPWILVHTEAFDTRKEALIREKQLNLQKEDTVDTKHLVEGCNQRFTFDMNCSFKAFP